jgi:ABC-type Zn uptake system ZnuABC Zn-binding protein ZnuA
VLLLKIKRFISLGIILFLCVSACKQPHSQDSKPSISEKRLKILTTIPPLYSFTKNITGDLAQVENLLPSGMGPHEYSFSPADVKKIKEAHVLIKNGVNLEAWLNDLIASAANKKLIVIDTSSGIEVIDNNPHIWLSPRNAIIQVRNISNALSEICPENSRTFKENAERYIKRLEQLDREIREEADSWRKNEFVSSHPAFLYFAREYSLRQAAVVHKSAENEPSPRHVAYVIDKIKAEGIKAIFLDRHSFSKITMTIAKDLNLQVYTLDTMETGIPYPELYEEKMRQNLAVFKKALK